MNIEEPLSDNESPVGNEEEWLLEKALELFNEGDYEEAHILCRQVTNLHGRLADDAAYFLERIEEQAQFYQAILLFRQEKYETAWQLFRDVMARAGELQANAREYMERIQRRLESFPLGSVQSVESEGSAEAETSSRPELPSYAEDWESSWESGGSALSSDPPTGGGGGALESAGGETSAQPISAEEVEEAAAESSAELPKEVIIKKVPHMDIGSDSEIRAGAKLDVSIFVDDSSERPGEKSDALEFNAPPEMKEFKTEVRLLATPHFIIDDEEIKNIFIHRDKPRSNSAEFKVVVKSEAELETIKDFSVAGLTAVFAYLGRISGKVSRKVPIVGVAAAPEASREPAAPETKPVKEKIVIDAVAQPADLTVEIISTPENDGRHFWCTVRTPLLPQYANGVTGEWNLVDSTSNIVDGYMKDFTTKGMGPAQRLASLKGAGRKLFEASPKVFQKAFWELIDSHLYFRTISIVSEEPYMPWELMIPRRKVDGQFLSHQALGVEYVIGRWIPKHAVSGRQKLPMSDCYVIAPNYVDRRALKHAQDESAFLIKTFPAPAGQSVKPADFNNIAATFKAGGKTIVHFACHGAVTNGKQVIYLESGPPLSSDMVLGMEELEKAFGDKQPFVFMNACEVGRQVPGLAGVGGFAESFIDLGASAVIAPLWSVKDDLAHVIAREFYDSIRADPTRPFAEIMRSIRTRAYDPETAEDTYAAYCFYGDPLSSVA